MKQILLTAMHSGAGKTVMTCALLAALKKRGLDVRAFKCGPDYIDPMFHSRVLGVPSRNLDLYLQGRAGLGRSMERNRGDIAVIEGAMGYYDGLAGTTQGSAWETASALEIPAVLVLRPKGVGVSLAAQVRGMLTFRENSGIRALLLADCTTMLAAYLTPILCRETGLPVLGYLPPCEAAVLESRHLGLLTAAEIRDLRARMDVLAAQLEQTVRIDDLLALAKDNRQEDAAQKKAAGDGISGKQRMKSCAPAAAKSQIRCRIAVAQDKAFCFYYADSLDALREAGAALVEFRPSEDRVLPEDIDGLYLGGGYPELYAGILAGNGSLRQQIADAVCSGLPTIAECGGFLYLQQTLEDPEGHAFPMCGVLPGQGFRTHRLQRFGYLQLTTEENSLLFRRGEALPAHEFHYWDTTANGAALTATRANGKSWACGFVSPSLYAAFPHLHLDGTLPLAERFAAACAAHRSGSVGM